MPDTVVEQEVKPEVKPNSYSSLEARMGITPAPAETPAPGAKPEGNQPAASEEKKEETPAAAAEAKPTQVNVEELTDEQINDLIEKRTGKKVSLADLTKPEPKTPEELEKIAADKKKDAFAWAIENGKFNKDDYEKSIVLKSKTDEDLVFSAFYEDAKAEDKDITLEEAQEMFKDAYHLGDDTTKLYKIGQKEIKSQAEAIRKAANTIPDYESEYDQFATLNEQFKAYKTTVKKVASEISKEMEFKMPYQYLDGEKSEITYKVPVDEKLFNKLIADASSQDVFLNENDNGKVDEKALAKKIQHNLKAVMYDVVIPELLKQNTAEVEKRMEVVLGNKRNGAPALNNGRQETKPTTVKQNTYSALDKAMAGRR